MLREVVKQTEFRQLIDTTSPRKRMVDEELALRFFALRDKYNEYKPPIKRFLNEYMQSVKEMEEEEIEKYKLVFNETVQRLSSVLGDKAFRITDANGTLIERTVNRALFDAQMTAFSWLTENNDFLTKKEDDIFKEFSKLYQDQEFLDSIQRATSDKARTQKRMKGVVKALQNAGLTLNIPFDLS